MKLTEWAKKTGLKIVEGEGGWYLAGADKSGRGFGTRREAIAAAAEDFGIRCGRKPKKAGRSHRGWFEDQAWA